MPFLLDPRSSVINDKVCYYSIRLTFKERITGKEKNIDHWPLNFLVFIQSNHNSSRKIAMRRVYQISPHYPTVKRTSYSKTSSILEINRMNSDVKLCEKHLTQILWRDKQPEGRWFKSRLELGFFPRQNYLVTNKYLHPVFHTWRSWQQITDRETH